MGDSDQENETPQHFEGVEKLMEVWFTKTDPTKQHACDLRKIPRWVTSETMGSIY